MALHSVTQEILHNIQRCCSKVCYSVMLHSGVHVIFSDVALCDI